VRDDKTMDWLEGPRGGVTFEPKLDLPRLNSQMKRVYTVMLASEWMTLREISDETGDPEASISARLRDFRKERFGSWTVDRRRRGDPAAGVHEYRLSSDILDEYR
jgi:hypothetical protein